MIKFLLSTLLMASSAAALAQSHYVHPYTKKDGTYVQGHYKTAPDDTKLNNYSTKGNLNPYTGEEGTVDPYKVELLKPLAVPSKTCFKDVYGAKVCY
jgi:hypothetical protein